MRRLVPQLAEVSNLTLLGEVKTITYEAGLRMAITQKHSY